jgi:hypothetical protein
MFSAPAPLLVKHGLDWYDVLSGDGPFADGQGKYIHRIIKGGGRQHKMKKSENNW